MVLCLIALPVFAVLGIFSVKYRKLAVEAIDCLFKTATLRKCKSGLDDRIKAEITGKALKFSPKAAGFIYRHYKAMSWIIVVVFLWSVYESSVGIYNYAKFGNCNGPAETGLCLLDPTGKNNRISSVDVDIQREIVYPMIEKDDPIIGNEKAELTVIEFGCYACPYTKKAEPIVEDVIDYYKGKVNFQFKSFYIPPHSNSYQSALAANCAQEQGAYHQYHKLLFELQENMSSNKLSQIAETLGVDTKKFDECLEKEKYKSEVEADTLMGMHAGVTGTPTFFINKQKIVGPKPFRTFRALIDEELEK
ncbi:MAG: thioredoxin domain-containing protein [Nanoarchaeota archaeon]